MYVLIMNKRMYLYADNHKILTFSEQYATEWNAKRAARKAFPDIRRMDSKGLEF